MVSPVTGLLRRIGMIQNSAADLGSAIGLYVYAYFYPQDWRDAMKQAQGDEVSLEAPTPFYVGIGRGDRFSAHIGEALKGKRGLKRDVIRNIIDAGEAPDIRFLAYGLPVDEEVEGDEVSRIIETILINLYGVERNVEKENSFERRMGFPASLTNIAKSSTPVSSGTVATVSAEVLRVNKEGVGFIGLNPLMDEIKEKFNVEHVVTIGITESYNSNSNIDQLREITCEWWDPGSSKSIEALEDSFVAIGWSSDQQLVWNVEGGAGKSKSVPVIRAAFKVSKGELEWSEERVSFKNRARFDEDLWFDTVGYRLKYSAFQLQGQHFDRIETEPKGIVGSVEDLSFGE
jgi:hypothetical protein